MAAVAAVAVGAIAVGVVRAVVVAAAGAAAAAASVAVAVAVAVAVVARGAALLELLVLLLDVVEEVNAKLLGALDFVRVRTAEGDV